MTTSRAFKTSARLCDRFGWISLSGMVIDAFGVTSVALDAGSSGQFGISAVMATP